MSSQRRLFFFQQSLVSLMTGRYRLPSPPPPPDPGVKQGLPIDGGTFILLSGEGLINPGPGEEVGVGYYPKSA